MADADVRAKQICRTFSREFNLSFFRWIHSNNQNVLQTSNHFQTDHNQVQTCIKAGEKYKKNTRVTKNKVGRLILNERKKTSATVPRTEEARENNEEMVVSLKIRKNLE